MDSSVVTIFEDLNLAKGAVDVLVVRDLGIKRRINVILLSLISHAIVVEIRFALVLALCTMSRLSAGERREQYLLDCDNHGLNVNDRIGGARRLQVPGVIN